MYISTANLTTPKPVTGVNNKPNQNPSNPTIPIKSGSVGTRANLGGGGILDSLQSNLLNTFYTPVVGTLQPLANVLTIVQSPYFWLNAGGLLVGIILTILSLYVIMQSELLGIKKGK